MKRVFPTLLWTAPAALAQEAELPEPRPLAPPVEIPAYPPWVIPVVVVAALLLLALIAWAIARWYRNRPAPPPPTPRERAIAALEGLRVRVQAVDPYPFSIEVSDVLRTYITEQYKISATQRTSPEFLEAVAGHSAFSENDRALLAVLLEKADLIKFARVQATTADSERLLEQATLFVKGGTPS